MLERYDQKLVVFLFYDVFMSYCPSFMVLGLFKATLRPGTCLRVKPKNSSFSCFMVIFMSYCSQFLGSSGFACLERTLTCLRVITRNSPFSRFMAVFMSYCPQFWDSRAIYNDFKTR